MINCVIFPYDFVKLILYLVNKIVGPISLSLSQKYKVSKILLKVENCNTLR